MNVAYGKRSRFMIWSRIKINRLFIILRGLNKKLTKHQTSQIKSILIYPAIKKQSELAEILNKVVWSFPPKKNLQITIPVNFNFDADLLSNLQTPDFQRRYLNNASQINIINKSESKKYFSSDLILLHKWIYFPLLALRRQLQKVEIIDKYFFGLTEGNVWKKKYHSTFTETEKEEFRKISRNNFLKLKERTKNCENSFLFLTGPTFSEYNKFIFPENSIKILCNTIIKNEEFLNHIQSFDILAFSDPVFHFSSCEYAARYRDNVMETIRKYDNFITVPEETVPLMLAHYPEVKDRIIGLANLPVNSDKIIIPDENNLLLRGATSVVTYFMLPLATSLSKNIFLIGADGRQKGENYFWKHNSSVQYDDLMASVFNTHPSFFRDRDYEDFYDKHCAYFEEFLQFGEKAGRTYKSLTPSFIPALEKRVISADEKKQMEYVK